ncbi:MAG: lactate/malate dehydrogenase family protein [Planctomycetes bacterium]|nr:lactate/malate dehydrogenase family protein [Planctomycetota bacterium]
MKVSIIGGGGLVGSMTAYALQCGGVVSDLCLIDANQDLAQGQATDLLHGASLAADQRISAGDFRDVADSQVVVITAGLRRQPDESRLDLINRNVDLFLTLLDQVKAAGLKDNASLVVVSNPVDVLTYLAVQRSGLPWQRVLGLGTQLDTARFRSYLARRLHVPPTQVQALILGEHGDSMVPIWSSATVAGLPLEQWPGFSPAVQSEVFEETKTAGAKLLKLKGGSGFGVGLSIREVVHALALDSRKVLPVSSLQSGPYGLHDVCLSVPTVVGCGGVRRQVELPLTEKERLGLLQSARILRETIQQVEERIGGGGAQEKPATASRTTGSSNGGRVIPRSAWQTAR